MNLINMKPIREQTREIKAQLPMGVNVPVSIMDINVSEFLKIVPVNVIFIEVLIFILEIPLVSNDDFILYKPQPLPIKLKHSVYGIIKPNSDYIAIDKTRLYYINLSIQQLTKCKETTDSIMS